MEIEDLFFVGYPLWRFVELDESKCLDEDDWVWAFFFVGQFNYLRLYLSVVVWNEIPAKNVSQVFQTAIYSLWENSWERFD